MVNARSASHTYVHQMLTPDQPVEMHQRSETEITSRLRMAGCGKRLHFVTRVCKSGYNVFNDCSMSP